MHLPSALSVDAKTNHIDVYRLSLRVNSGKCSCFKMAIKARLKQPWYYIVTSRYHYIKSYKGVHGVVPSEEEIFSKILLVILLHT